ncbi:glycosyl hydrolase family 18 protein [Melghirimyces algeriensis]|uniref:Glycosyl hydrolases family 18 n=1 Tax=Melghirimyces algeriensis TaxID=910412 RepID=A0A521EN41_9BACL|nr:glycosyl hydrolase family 18 protein [Melghirimyces algeriensis]SMO85353.1 Glycosyl hydrolases family 18 [Melghirimyces algeriensis]
MRNQYDLQPKEEQPKQAKHRTRSRKKRPLQILRKVASILFLALVTFLCGWMIGFLFDHSTNQSSSSTKQGKEYMATEEQEPQEEDNTPPDWWDFHDPPAQSDKTPNRKKKNKQTPTWEPSTVPSRTILHNNWRNPDLTHKPSKNRNREYPSQSDIQLEPPSLRPNDSPHRREMQVSVRLPYWEMQTAIHQLNKEGEQMDEVNFPWYDLQPDGKLEVRPVSKKAKQRVRSIVTKYNMRIIPVIGSQYSPSLLHDVLTAPEKRRLLTNEILKLTEEQGYHGVEIQFQPVLQKDQERFTDWMKTLSKKLHQKNRWLSVAVYPKTSSSGEAPLQDAQNWARLGQAADTVKIMAYHYSWEKPGPSAPLSWLEKILTYAQKEISPEKIYLSIPTHGYLWSDVNQLAPLTYEEAQTLIQQREVRVHRDKNGEAWFRYQRGERARTAYYQDAFSYRQKIRFLMKQYPDLGGIAHWYLGAEDPNIWAVLKKEN